MKSDTDADRPALTPEMIERFRQVGIRLDREGRFWHEGAEITHPGLRRALLQWMDVRAEDGRPILRLDETRYAYLDVDDAHLLAVAARWEGDRVFVTYNDGAEEELAYDSLRAGSDAALYCAARDGALEARITTKAYYVIAEGLEETDAGAFALRAAGALHPIGQRSS